MLPPPGFASPPWAALAAQWDAAPAPSTPTATLGPCTITMGHDDQEPDDLLPELEHDVAAHEFGWDNESPARAVEVGAFRVDWRPVTNGEFEAFWRGAGKGVVAMPASWVEDKGEDGGAVQVRTLYGPVPMEYARHWPVLTAYDDLAAYAAHKGGRIPSEAELRLFLDTYQVGYEQGANTGFRNWHPLPATAGLGDVDGGRGSNGGVWEWTATALDTHPGFEGTGIFPGCVCFLWFIEPSIFGRLLTTVSMQVLVRLLRRQAPGCAGGVVCDNPPFGRPTHSPQLLPAQLPVPVGRCSRGLRYLSEVALAMVLDLSIIFLYMLPILVDVEWFRHMKLYDKCNYGMLWNTSSISQSRCHVLERAPYSITD